MLLSYMCEPARAEPAYMTHCAWRLRVCHCVSCVLSTCCGHLLFGLDVWVEPWRSVLYLLGVFMLCQLSDVHSCSSHACCPALVLLCKDTCDIPVNCRCLVYATASLHRVSLHHVDCHQAAKRSPAQPAQLESRAATRVATPACENI